MKTPPQSLQQYQQGFRNPAENELQQQNSPNKSLIADEKSVIQKTGGAIWDALKQGLENSKEYGKEVITGKKLWEGLKENDGVIDGMLAHGATELANMLLHGHPAPVYARSLAPSEQQPEVVTSVHGEPANAKSQTQRQAAVDIELPQEMSLELYQRSMVQEHQYEKQQEMEP